VYSSKTNKSDLPLCIEETKEKKENKNSSVAKFGCTLILSANTPQRMFY
jgi:hypothetical protein